MEVLSQSEIDRLLEALDSGELDVTQVEKDNRKKTREYDFSRPNKFSKEQMRTLHAIHEYYVRLLTTYLSGILRTTCHVEIMSVEEQIFHEFNNSLSDPVILAVINMPPLKSEVLMEVSTSAAYGMIDRILGGTGGAVNGGRDYTEIELALMERIISRIIMLFRDSWSNVVDVEPSLDRIETNSRFIQVLSPNETIAIITLAVNIGDVEGLINICIPNVGIKPFEEKMSSRLWFSRNVAETEEALEPKALMQLIRESTVDIKAILGETSITVREVLELQQGDVIQLNSKISNSVKICVGDIVKFYGAPGVINDRVAIKIMSRFDEEEENE
jgi:flagellar motor switch protein FliM